MLVGVLAAEIAAWEIEVGVVVAILAAVVVVAEEETDLLVEQ